MKARNYLVFDVERNVSIRKKKKRENGENIFLKLLLINFGKHRS